MSILDIEAIEHLDFDAKDEDACQAEGCEDTATWGLTLPCCFFTIHLCDKCMKKHERWMNIMCLFDLKVIHQTCGAEWTAQELDEKQIVVPL